MGCSDSRIVSFGVGKLGRVLAKLPGWQPLEAKITLKDSALGR
jgi:hypothetical protein